VLGLQDGKLELALFFPFESFDEAGFLQLVEALEDSLGKVLTASRFSLLSPASDGKRMTAKLRRFAR